MSTESIERIENLIRVVSNVSDDKFDLSRWYNPITGCGCALWHASQDAYFIARRFSLDFPIHDIMKQIGHYFDISEARVRMLFINWPGYKTRHDVLAALRVLLLEKMAKELELATSDAWEDDEWDDLTEKLENA